MMARVITVVRMIEARRSSDLLFCSQRSFFPRSSVSLKSIRKLQASRGRRGFSMLF